MSDRLARCMQQGLNDLSATEGFNRAELYFNWMSRLNVYCVYSVR